jgi:hypothetical protein
MNNHEPPECPEGISSERLSTWRDGGLSQLDARIMKEHVRDCAACRAIVADYERVAHVLRGQQELEPGERVLSGVESRVARRQKRPLSLTWRQLGSMAAVLAVVGLFAAVLGVHIPSRPLVKATETAVRPTATSVPPTPSPTPAGPFSSSVSYKSAWGPHAVIASYNMNLDATHRFAPSSLSPDGSMLLGGEWITTSNSSTFQAGYLDLATRRFTAIGVSDGGDPVECCSSDGRFLVVNDSSAPGAPGSQQYYRYWAYDLETGHLRLVATAHQFGGAVFWALLSRGLLVLATNEGLQVANLAAGTIAPLRVSKPGQYQLGAFAWPYLVYHLLGQLSPYRLYNFVTGVDAPFTAFQAFSDAHFSSAQGQGGLQTLGDSSYLISGDSMEASVVAGQVVSMTGVVTNNGVTTIYALDHILSGGTGQRVLATFNGDLGGIIGADPRLMVGVNAVWDLTLRTVVTFPEYLIRDVGQVPDSGILSFAGGYLAVAQGNTGNERVLIFNSSTLPTSPATTSG